MGGPRLSHNMYDQAFFKTSWASSKNSAGNTFTSSSSAVAVRERERAMLPGHLLSLNDDGWALWRCW
jgi:hypothetical protein